MKNIVVSSSTSSRVSWLQVWKQMHLWLIVATVDNLMVSATISARSRRRYSWSGRYSERKKRPMLSWNSAPMNSVERKFEELGLNASAGHTWNSQDATWKKMNSGKKMAIWRHYLRVWTSWAKSFARPVRRNNLLRKPHDKQIEPAKQRGIWREIFLSSSPRTKLRFILLWRRQRDSMFIVHPGASMHNVEQGDLSWDTMDILRRSETTMCDLPRPGTVRINE